MAIQATGTLLRILLTNKIYKLLIALSYNNKVLLLFQACMLSINDYI